MNRHLIPLRVIGSRHTLILLLVGALYCGCAPTETETTDYQIVIYGGTVMDPESGLEAMRNVGIQNGVIVAVEKDSIRGEKMINATGLIVSPGFIDLHVHGQLEESYALMVQDGVTTGFELEVGTADVPEWYAERAGGQIVNYGVSIGHIQVRMAVMGDESDFLPSGPGGSDIASDGQVAEMEELMEKGLAAGAVGVGFGLVYTPAATPQEFETMLSIANKHGATAFIHVRGGPNGLREAIEAADKTGASLHVVHANSSGGARTAAFLQEIQDAVDGGQDITTEAYPYEAGMTMIESAMFDDWESWTDDQIRIHQWPETGEWLNRESFGRYRAEGGIIIIHNRTEEMTLAAIRSPLTMIASDGGVWEGKGHPRTSGTYAKVLGKYVRDQGVLTLMDALRRMTIEPAQRLESFVPAMGQKGRIQVGTDADITIFDPSTIIDKSTYTDPNLTSEGVEYVLVNGVLVVEGGELLPGVRAGKPVRRD